MASRPVATKSHSAPPRGRVLFALASGFNLATGALLLFGRPLATRWLDLDPVRGANLIAMYLCASIILLFGILYAAVANDPQHYRRLILPGAASKVLATASALVPWLSGQVGTRIPLLMMVDVAFAALFVRHLMITRDV